MPTVLNPLDLTSARIGALLNTASGSCDADAESTLETLLEEHGLQAIRVWCGGGEEVDQALAEAAAHDLDVLIVLGGDGTIRAAAQACDERGPLLVPLPGGTMNMLPKALYGDRSWQEALRATLDDPTVQAVHGGASGKISSTSPPSLARRRCGPRHVKPSERVTCRRLSERA